MVVGQHSTAGAQHARRWCLPHAASASQPLATVARQAIIPNRRVLDVPIIIGDPHEIPGDDPSHPPGRPAPGPGTVGDRLGRRQPGHPACVVAADFSRWTVRQTLHFAQRRACPSGPASRTELAARETHGVSGDRPRGQRPRPDFLPDSRERLALKINAPGWTRTTDPGIRNPMLYPAELRARGLCCVCGDRLPDAGPERPLCAPGKTARRPRVCTRDCRHDNPVQGIRLHHRGFPFGGSRCPRAEAYR